MKKILLSFLVITISTFSLMAQVNRTMVLIEIGTGTACPYCPGAAMGLHDLYTNGDPVAGIEYHQYAGGAPFNTPEGAIRTSYYGISSYPTAQFDGEYNEYVGGSNTNTLYSSYLPIVNARMADQTNFEVEIYGENSGNNYEVVVRVTEVGSYTGGALKVYFALTETAIPYNWQGQTMVDYCDRLMAPDGNGTSVSFASGSEIDVPLTFTFNSTWVDSNCELIAWIQDGTNKYVLATESVMLLDLEPDAASSNFTCDETMVCEGSSVQFTDMSGGAITSWEWTFEGGTPATSTDQNPTVVYNTQGVYDVTLYVTDGPTNSTMLIEDMIEAIVAPVQPVAPVGEMDACNDGTYLYTTQPVPYTDTYVWELTPADAGTLTPNGTEATFEADGSWTGAYTVMVRADNSCGNGIMSAPISCTLNYTPVAFMLSEGGGYCEGGSGLEVTQDGSETGINYELYLDGVYTGTTLAGTGNPLNYGYQTDEGVYTVMGIASVCDVQMFGTPWIYVLETPEQASTPDGPTAACNSTITNYTVSIIDYADTIYWDLTPVGAGIVIGGDFEADIEWDIDFAGTAYLTAQGVNDCGAGPVSDQTDIEVSQSPVPEVAGETLVCDNEPEEYSAEEITGSTYDWEIVGGTITSGAGTSIITVMWGNPGTGSVKVTETSAMSCEGSSEVVSITIDGCIGIDEAIIENEISLYPNPATTNVELVFNEKAGSSYTVTVYNTVGQVMTEINGISFGEKQNVNIDVANYQSGMYIVNLVTKSGKNIRSTFEKAK